MKLIDGHPRRRRMDHLIPAEKACYDAVTAIEVLGADTRLTEAQNLIDKARELVADWVDEQPEKASAYQLRLSAAGDYFYIDGGGWRPRHWMGMEKHPGPVPKEKQDATGFMKPSWCEFKNTVTGEVFHREVLEFAFWKVKGPVGSEPIEPTDDRWKDYAAMSGWAPP